MGLTVGLALELLEARRGFFPKMEREQSLVWLVLRKTSLAVWQRGNELIIPGPFRVGSEPGLQPGDGARGLCLQPASTCLPVLISSHTSAASLLAYVIIQI